MKKLLIPFLTANLLFAALPPGEADESVPAINGALARIRASADTPAKADAALLRGQIHVMIRNHKFAANEKAAENIRTATEAARILVSGLKQIDAKSDQPVIDETNQVLANLIDEIALNIDENWKFPLVNANVSPPAGVGPAMAGMNPDAIKDPALRQQYLDLIAENQRINLKNGQQRELRRSLDDITRSIALATEYEGAKWTKEEALARFGTKKSSKAALEQAFKP